ncbi:MAG: hypothetical protein H7843_15765 [Nitrospirota bacterium]
MLKITVIDKDSKEIYMVEYPDVSENKRIEDVIYKAIGDAIAAIKKITSPAPVNSYAAKIHEAANQVNGVSDWSGDVQISVQLKSYQAKDFGNCSLSICQISDTIRTDRGVANRK